MKSISSAYSTSSGNLASAGGCLSLRNLKRRRLRSVGPILVMIVATNDLEVVCIATLYVGAYMKIDAGSKVKTARTWLCFQRPCAFVVSGLRVTMRITRKCPAVRFAL